MKENIKANKILYIMLLIILFISNLFIGTPIRYNMMYINLIVNITVIICFAVKYFKNKEKIAINKLDVCVILITFSTFLPLIFNTYLRLADTIEYILRYITVLNVYIITKILVKNNKEIANKLFDVIIFSSILLIIFGIDMMTKNFFQDFYNILGIPKIINESNYRMGSLFKYPNILGIFLVISIILSIIRYISNEKCKHKCIYAVTLYIQMFGLIMTYSRLSFLIMIIAFIILILTEKDKVRRNNIIKLIISSIVSSWIYFILFNIALKSENCINIYIILVIQSAIFYIIEKYLENIKLKCNKNILTCIVIFTILIIFSIIYSLVFSKNGIMLFKNINEEKVYRKQNILVEPNKEYVVEFEIESSSNIKNNFKIQCKEIDKNGKEIEIHEEKFDNYSGNIIIKFTSNELTKTISLVFNNTNKESTGFLNINSVKINGNEEKISYGIIPIELINRVTKIKIDTSSLSGRLEYYKESIELIKNNFFTGLGGYAWKNSEIQTESGGIAEHSYPLQLFMQNGVLSFAAYIILIIILFKNIRKKINKNIKIEEKGLYIIVFALILHSLFDFDMYFLNILIIFYALIAIISSENNNSYNIMISHKYSFLYIIIVIFALYFSIGEIVTSIIGDNLKNYNYLQAKIVMVPYDYNYRRDKINYLSTIKNKSTDKINKEVQIKISKEIIKEEEYLIEKEKTRSSDDIGRLIINYIDIISNNNENEILQKIYKNFKKINDDKNLIYTSMESRFKRKYFNDNIDEFLNILKEENNLSEEFIDDNN